MIAFRKTIQPSLSTADRPPRHCHIVAATTTTTMTNNNNVDLTLPYRYNFHYRRLTVTLPLQFHYRRLTVALQLPLPLPWTCVNLPRKSAAASWSPWGSPDVDGEGEHDVRVSARSSRGIASSLAAQLRARDWWGQANNGTQTGGGAAETRRETAAVLRGHGVTAWKKRLHYNILSILVSATLSLQLHTYLLPLPIPPSLVPAFLFSLDSRPSLQRAKQLIAKHTARHRAPKPRPTAPHAPPTLPTRTPPAPARGTRACRRGRRRPRRGAAA